MKAEDSKLLQTRELVFGYEVGGKEKRILGGPLDLSLRSGELVCLLGPNGAGKSTLLRTLCGFLTPLSGSIEIGEKQINKCSPRDLARLRSVLPTRESYPDGMIAEELVALGRHPHSNWRGQLTAADRAAIDSAFQDTASQAFRSRRVGELSDGERQRVSLARLLAQDTKIAFLDEPAAFLDLPSRIEVLGKLAKLAQTRTMGLLVTTHDLESALRHADRIWLLGKDGQWEEGVPEDLVLRGSFPKTFPSPELDFDTIQGTFHPKRYRGIPITISGEGDALRWTQRALIRLGWEPLIEQESSLLPRIEITKRADQLIWKIQQKETPDCSASSIEECIRNLKVPEKAHLNSEKS